MARGAERTDDHPATSGQNPAVGRMSAPLVNLDFVAHRRPLTFVSGLLLLLGLAAAAAACLEYRYIETRREGMELKLEAALRRGHRDPGVDVRAAGVSGEAGRV